MPNCRRGLRHECYRAPFSVPRGAAVAARGAVRCRQHVVPGPVHGAGVARGNCVVCRVAARGREDEPRATTS